MSAMPLSALFANGVAVADCMVSGITLDSRKVMPGFLFLAIKGEQSDGHRFIDAAIKNGAVAVAVEDGEFFRSSGAVFVVEPTLRDQAGVIAARFYGDPSRGMTVIGVTGTNGKTSITSYISQLLGVVGVGCGVIGTLGVCIGEKVEVTGNTTPDAVSLQAILASMLDEGVRHVAMEVSSHALEQGRCNGIHLSGAVYTNLSHDHLDYHGNMAAYADAKAKLFAWPALRVAVINIDDAHAATMLAAVAADVKVVTYSLCNPAADLFLSGISRHDGAYHANLCYCGEVMPFTTSLVGEFNLYNLLAAVAVVCEHGFLLENVVAAAALVCAVSGRMETVRNTHGITAIVDYAHSPDAMEKVLAAVRGLSPGKVITVFGCGGNRDAAKRPVMAQVAERYSDFVIVTADNPRYESVDEINRQIHSGFSVENRNYLVCADRREAISRAVAMASSNDCILVCGKGHEKYQIIGSEILPFDDVEVLGTALSGKRGVLPC